MNYIESNNNKTPLRYIEFSDCRSQSKTRKWDGALYYLGTPDQDLIEELSLRKKWKYRDGSGEEYESTLPEITAKGWDLVFVLPSAKHTRRGKFGEGTIIENTYIFKRTQ